jgi:hypothetical protein
MDRETNRWMDRQTGWTDRQVDRTGRQTDRLTDGRTKGPTEGPGWQVRIRHWRSHQRRASRGWPFWKRLLRA